MAWYRSRRLSPPRQFEAAQANDYLRPEPRRFGYSLGHSHVKGRMVRAKDVTVGIPGFLSITLSASETDNLKERFNRRSLYGPCMIIDRWSGLAMDSTPDPKHQTRPVLWTVHALPWQQWRIKKVRDNMVKITSEHGGLALTTDQQVGDGSWLWLEEDIGLDSQLWRLHPTRDHGAFAIYSCRSAYALDATRAPNLPAAGENHDIDNPTAPIMWTNDWRSWQQWVITRLPLT